MDPVNSTSSNAAVAAASRPSLDSHSKHEQQAPDDDDDDLDPAKFLQSVRELSHQREREDSERFRKLEEEVEKGRQERLARRAERARSITERAETPSHSLPSPLQTPSASNAISPPPLTPPSLSTTITSLNRIQQDTASQSPMDGSQRKISPSGDDIPEFKGFGSISRPSSASAQNPPQSPETSSKPSPSTGIPTRQATNPWLRRPTSRPNGARPLSTLARENSAHAREPSVDQPEPSRDQIAASLGSHDHSWFRQTADRGAGNAAFRKSKEETGAEESAVGGRRHLPGLSREASVETAKPSSPARESVISDTSSSKADPARDTSWMERPQSASVSEEPTRTPSMSDRASTADSEQSGLGRSLTMSSSQARIATGAERPSSPTKGTGGFVQSAMMRRTDSVSKRWSAQPGGSLSRQGSTVSRSGIGSIKDGYGGLQGSHSMPRLESTSSSREASNEPVSRPSSSSSNLTNLTINTNDKDGFKRPALPHHSRSRTIGDSYSINAPDANSSRPSSPTKLLPSPSKNKSSWLESALTKPESPQASPTKEKEQPTWMANIAKAKEQRASVDLSKTSTPKPAEEATTPRSGSPTKVAFGQSMLKRSESRDLRKEAPAPVRSVTPPTKARPPNLSSRPTTLATSETLPSAPPSASSNVEPISTMPSTEVEGGPTDDTDKEQSKNNGLADEPASQPTPQPEEPRPAEDEVARPAPLSLKGTTSSESPVPLNIKSAAKPETPPKKDFRGNLKARPPPDVKPKEEPEFLSKFGALRKAQTQKYQAPDVLKDNILRGKSGLAVTDGPQKTVRRDELKESLLAKKDEWRSAKEEGKPTQRAPAGPPQTPTKPEALVKKDAMGRTESLRKNEAPEKPKDATPEALSRFRSLQDKPKPTPAAKPDVTSQAAPKPAESARPWHKPEKQTSLPTPRPAAEVPETSDKLERQTSAPSRPEPKQVNETSRLASRFNPGLANILARGPPAATSGPDESRSASSAMPKSSGAAFTPSEPPAEGGQLQDMRKGRAKGPKKRKGDAKTQESARPEAPPVPNASKPTDVSTGAKTPQPPTKSAAVRAVSASMSPKPSFEEKPSPIVASPASTSPVEEKQAALPKPLFASRRPDPQLESKPATPTKKPSIVLHESRSEKAATPKRNAVPEFQGFGSIKRPQSSEKPDENKENADSDAPSVKNVTSFWSKSPATKPSQPPSQIQLPSRKDEEAALRSAGLLARSPSRPSSNDGSGAASPPPSAGAPPKPSKSSRIVSGQLREASTNKDVPQLPPFTETEEVLQTAFGQVQHSTGPLQINVQDLLNEVHLKEADQSFKTLRRTIIEYTSPDGAPTKPSQQDEYTLYDSSVYAIAHTSTSPTISRKTCETHLWIGKNASSSLLETATAHASTIAKDFSPGPPVQTPQSHEPASLFHALGGILITRKGTRQTASKNYMLCGRKHHSHIAFDELPSFAPGNLNSAFVYLLSHPKTLLETVLYLWKGSAASAEEISAARLAAMDLSQTGEVIEVDDGAEFSSFLKIFGLATSKADICRTGGFWARKRLAPEKFCMRLFAVRKLEVRGTLSGGLFGIFGRRPSGQASGGGGGFFGGGGAGSEEVKVEVKQVLPFAQDSFDAEGIFLLDVYSELYVLVGPMFAAQMQQKPRLDVSPSGGGVPAVLLSQTLQLAAEYALVTTSSEDRPQVPKAWVVLPGAPTPRGLEWVCRFWDEGRGFWGTEGLMAGSAGVASSLNGKGVLELEEAMGRFCRPA